MKNSRNSSLSHKEWRRLAKKLRRKRIRRKIALTRDSDEKQLRATLERSANYLNWTIEQEKLAKEREIKEAEEHAEQEKLWLEAEVKAQKTWQEIQERKAKARQEQLQQEEIIRKEFEAKQETLKKKREEFDRLKNEEFKRQENIEREIHEYIDNGTKTPETLRLITDSQPGKELCPFFSKTAACKYGDTCSRNHRKSALSKIIVVPGFYNHFSLEKYSAEYDTDIGLEYENSETREHYREFYKDIVPELESFGRIKTLKCCCNTEMHLRGNLYVEYDTEREAARSWRRLKGRWYGGRQINCEFANFKSWRNAVCGMTKCPKGRACNFLHTFRNPGDDYDMKSPPRWMKKQDRESSNSKRSKMNNDESTRSHNRDERRNWRWSESPQPEIKYERSDDKRHNKHRDSSRHEKRRTKSRDRHSKSTSSRSKAHKSSSSTPKQKKRRRSISKESYEHSKKYCDTNKENGSDCIKKSINHKKSKKDKSKSRGDKSKQNLQKDDQSNSTIETFKDSSSKSPSIEKEEKYNDWDTTDSDNEI